MTTTKKRKQVTEFVTKKADDRFINMVYAMMQEYAAALKPLTEEEFLEQFNESVADIKAGRVVSHEKLKNKFSAK